MRIFAYNELDEIIQISEDEIIKQYWDYYCKQMAKVNKIPTKRNCIENFVVTNWAWEVKDKKCLTM